RLERVEPDTLTLRALEEYRDGRPFLDGIQVRMSRPVATQLSDLEAGRADLVGIQATDTRRVLQRGMHLTASSPIELVPLVFGPHAGGDDFAPVRRTLSSIVNRATLCDVLLQQQALPARAFLPQWISGFAGSLQSGRPPLTRSALAALPAEQREIVVRVEASDSLLRDLAERIAVDAREGGLSMKVQAPAGLAPRPDARLVRVRLPATTPERAFAELAERLGQRVVPDTSASSVQSVDVVYRTEASLLDRSVAIPIVHL